MRRDGGLARVARTALAGTYRLRARWSSGRVGLALCYHRIGDSDGDPEQELNAAIAARAFASHLHHLQRCYCVVPASELLSAAASRARGQRIPVAITFDDDLPSHVSHALPALRRARLPATFFLSGAGLDGPFSFWWQLLQRAWDRGLVDARLLEMWSVQEHDVSIRAVARRIQAMSSAERSVATVALEAAVSAGDDVLTRVGIATLADAGFEIGFHTLAHDDLVALTDDELHRAMRAGRAELEAVVGPVATLSYPHGRADGRVAAAARVAGFRFGFRANGCPVGAGDDPHLLGRRYPARGTAGEFKLDVAQTLLTASR
jgi:peptidoglycan/xylan/chitin deacetylase (PgdA/CDA1 family)